MRVVLPAIYMTLLLGLVDHLSGCVSSTTLKEGRLLYPEKKSTKPKKEFHQLVETTVAIDDDNNLVADIFRPIKKSEPKTLVIMVPGSGNVSRRGEVTSDGVTNYENEVAANYLWASALAERGFFVLSYDKRTCTKSMNPLCNTNSQSDVENDGIAGLARDADAVVEFVSDKLKAQPDSMRIVLMSTTQGAQTIALASSKSRAHGIVLLSPIVTDLESMWVNGLATAAKTATTNQKTRLMNQKESMVSFFKSLKAGEFPETSIIRGASIKFWRTWIDATNNTVDMLKKNGRPTLMLFSAHDSFSAPEMLATVKKKLGVSSKISIKNIREVDRNFVTKNAVPDDAVNAVVTFINSLPAKSS